MNNFKVFKVRLGFATNSSSTHSIVFLLDAKDDMCGRNNDEFGWNNFVLASQQSKLDYLTVLLIENLKGQVPLPFIEAIVDDLGGKVDVEESYIDHQSKCYFPKEFRENYMDMQFFNEFKEFLLTDGVVILGGNDNDYDHPLASKADFIACTSINYNEDVICRKDKNVWVLFNTKTGTKVRIGFDDLNSIERGVNKSSTPELVDLKITDFCEKDCKICYQDSSKIGRHGDEGLIRSIIWDLADLKTFEIAFGGGEPTTHPGFLSLLKCCRSLGITPNFSTGSLKWLEDEKYVDDVFDNIGGFAYSVKGRKDVDDLVFALKRKNKKLIQVSLQHVIGSVSQWEFENICEAVKYYDLSLTLLGYKNVGRGENFEPYKFNWIDVLLEIDIYKVGVDTSLAKESEKRLKEERVSDLLYEIEEGKFSMYIDAVGKKIGPSSFCDESKMIPFEKIDKDFIVSNFAKF